MLPRLGPVAVQDEIGEEGLEARRITAVTGASPKTRLNSRSSRMCSVGMAPPVLPEAN